MEITEVRVVLRDSPDKKLKAYATVTFDNAFVVRNIKVIEGNTGLFIAMPSRKVKHPCPKCNFKNELRSKYCNQCGVSLPQAPKQLEQDLDAAQSEHKDIAHPITQSFREQLQKKILAAYEQEKIKGPSVSAY
jgi:stage V sporulation protein G